MGRKPSNSFQEMTVELKKGTEFRMFDVKLPLSCKVIFETTDPKIVKLQGEQVVNIPLNEKTRITKLFQDKGYRVLKIEPYAMQVAELCPSCHNRGVPKIEPKNTIDTRERKWRNKDPRQLQPREQEYWLSFTHNSRKKCKISRYLPNPYPSWKRQKNSNIPYTKFLFPYNAGWLKSQLSQ